LPLAHLVGIAEPGEDERDQAAGEDAGGDARRHQQLEGRREHAGQRVPASPAMQTWMQRALPKRSPSGTEKGLRQCIGQRVRRAEQCRSRRCHREVVRDRNDERIDDAQREAARERAHRKDEKDRQHRLVRGPGPGHEPADLRHCSGCVGGSSAQRRRYTSGLSASPVSMSVVSSQSKSLASPFELRNATLALVALVLRTSDLTVLAAALEERFGETPLFDHDPV
jgi:hypothetical protein